MFLHSGEPPEVFTREPGIKFVITKSSFKDFSVGSITTSFVAAICSSTAFSWTVLNSWKWNNPAHVRLGLLNTIYHLYNELLMPDFRSFDILNLGEKENQKPDPKLSNYYTSSLPLDNTGKLFYFFPKEAEMPLMLWTMVWAARVVCSAFWSGHFNTENHKIRTLIWEITTQNHEVLWVGRDTSSSKPPQRGLWSVIQDVLRMPSSASALS